MRPIDHKIFDIVVDLDVNTVAACCVGIRRNDLFHRLRELGISVDVYDYHPQLPMNNYNCIDVITDDVTFNHDLIINFNVENTYPIGKVHQGQMLLVYDDEPHPGNCTYYQNDITNNIAMDNNISIHSSGRIFYKKNYYYVLGTSCK